jgi:hypothetical protein
MSGGNASSGIAHVWPQLAHWHVMTVRLFTTSVQPLYWHLGQVIGSGQPVFGIGPKNVEANHPNAIGQIPTSAASRRCFWKIG